MKRFLAASLLSVLAICSYSQSAFIEASPLDADGRSACGPLFASVDVFALYIDNQVIDRGVVTRHKLNVCVGYSGEFYQVLSMEDSFALHSAEIRRLGSGQTYLVIIKGATDKGGGRNGEIVYQFLLKLYPHKLAYSEFERLFLDSDNYFVGPIIHDTPEKSLILSAVFYGDDILAEGSIIVVDHLQQTYQINPLD